jgi:hypothetical protein
MPNGHILQLADLPHMHPACGAGFLHSYALSAVYRLMTDPTLQPVGTLSRVVEVDWLAHPGNNPATQVQRSVGWANLQAHIANMNAVLSQLPVTMNRNDITAGAALAVTAVLIRELENRTIQRVLQIGSGGDYLVQSQGGAHSTQVEVSGIRQAAAMAVATTRVNQKKVQVLTHSNSGFASVASFSLPHPGGGTVVHCYLHYVVQAPAAKRPGKKKPNRGRK